MKNNKKIVIGMFILVLTFSMINIISAEGLGPFKQNENVELYQTCNNCTYCNFTRIKYPNGTNILTNVITTQDPESYFYYILDGGNTTTTGTYKYCYDCGNAAESATGCINFEVTLSGFQSPEGQSSILVGIFIIIFGIACVFLYLSDKMTESGPKIFFLLSAFTFLMGSIATASVIAFDSNLTSGVNTTISIMLFAFGMIFFVIFAYIMIRQTIEVLDLLRGKKGYISSKGAY